MWNKIKLILGEVWDFIKPFVLQLATEAGKIVQQVAIQTVAQVAADISAGKDVGDVKQYALDIAKEKLMTEGLQVGVDVATSFVNTTVELALQKAKADGTVA